MRALRHLLGRGRRHGVEIIHEILPLSNRMRDARYRHDPGTGGTKRSSGNRLGAARSWLPGGDVAASGSGRPPDVSASFPQAVTPIVMRGDAAGLSHRRISSSSPTGNVTQPAVGVPMLMCRKMALPSPGVRAVLYAITAP